LLQKVGQPTVAAASDLPDPVGTVADPTSRPLLRPLVAGADNKKATEAYNELQNKSSGKRAR